MEYCIKCGYQVTNEMMFCPKCGTKVYREKVEAFIRLDAPYKFSKNQDDTNLYVNQNNKSIQKGDEYEECIEEEDFVNDENDDIEEENIENYQNNQNIQGKALSNSIEKQRQNAEKLQEELHDTRLENPNELQKESLGMAITCIIFSILGFLTGFIYIGLLLDVIAVIIGVVALINKKRGKVLIIVGIIIATISFPFAFSLLKFNEEQKKMRNDSMIEEMEIVLDSKTEPFENQIDEAIEIEEAVPKADFEETKIGIDIEKEQVIIIAIILIILSWLIYENIYFSSVKFNEIKKSIQEHTKKCNELNSHIEKLKRTYIDMKRTDYGESDLTDRSIYNFKRAGWTNKDTSLYIHNCSSTVCKNSQNQPFKYICKYFNINADEDTLSNFEQILNNFAAVEQGKFLLKKERDRVVDNISFAIPYLIKKLCKKTLLEKLGFRKIDLSQLYFPEFTFKYVSAGGNSTMQNEIILNIANLEKFIVYLSNSLKYRRSIEGQRALMTTSLRNKIKARDNYSCQICSLSPREEPNLLLEIDHIVPLSKNGYTTEDNLQTLCWKCNRAKGSKIMKNV